MFNLSFGEIALVLILIILFLKPKDIPNIIYQTKKAYRKFLSLKDDFLSEVDELKDEVRELEDDLMNAGKIIKNEEITEQKDKPKKDQKNAK